MNLTTTTSSGKSCHKFHLWTEVHNLCRWQFPSPHVFVLTGKRQSMAKWQSQPRFVYRVYRIGVNFLFKISHEDVQQHFEQSKNSVTNQCWFLEKCSHTKARCIWEHSYTPLNYVTCRIQHATWMTEPSLLVWNRIALALCEQWRCQIHPKWRENVEQNVNVVIFESPNAF